LINNINFGIYVWPCYQYPVVLLLYSLTEGDRGSTLVKALCYKSEGRFFDSRWCQWNFSLI